MARSTSNSTKPSPPKKGKEEPRKEGNRDTVEQIVVAFILAFLVRGFSAEAFVIPTGSMAPTLMGRHKEVTCPECGNVYQVNASDEAEERLNERLKRHLEFGTCNNCRYQTRVEELPSFKGDRILVMKFLYSLPFLPGGGGPKRWDVVVFKYPEEPEVNYIKRLVGLPNEILRVYFGNILTRPLDDDKVPFKLQHRPLEHQQAMQMLVYDDRHRPQHFADFSEWRRWQTDESWSEEAAGKFIAKDTPDWASLRYSHRVPDPQQWNAVLTGKSSGTPPRPTLITDYYAYNTLEAATMDGRTDGAGWFQPHWVGDLTLSCKVEAASAKGLLRFELIRGGTPYRCEIDLASGQASLFEADKPLGSPQPSGIRPNTSHSVTFANVDGRLTLWVDGRTPFGDGVVYDEGSFPHPLPTKADLEPVGVAVKGGSVSVSDLVLKRDIYYTQSPGQPDYDRPFDGGRRMSDVLERLADPSTFESWAELKPKDYPIRPGHYMMMGDNSPRSKDGRGWEQKDQINPNYPESGGWDPNRRESWEVPEALLIGKAFYVYWPHGKPFGPNFGFSRDFRIPFRPYVERMKWIR
jgi:signal peptidase I